LDNSVLPFNHFCYYCFCIHVVSQWQVGLVIWYLLSLFNTSVANTVVIISSGPLFAALLGWFVLKEVVSIRTWISIVLAVSGMFVMFTGDVSSSDILGMVYAVLAVAAFAVMIVAVRRSTRPDMLAATCCAGLVAAAFSAFMMPSFTISTNDLLIAIGLGSFQIGAGFILIYYAGLSQRAVSTGADFMFAGNRASAALGMDNRERNA